MDTQQIDRQTERQQTERQTDRKTADRETDRQKDNFTTKNLKVKEGREDRAKKFLQ